MLPKNNSAYPSYTTPQTETSHENLNMQPLLSTVEMVERQQLVKKSRLDFWYKIAAPQLPKDTADLEQREAYRRGRLISIALLMILLIMLIVMFTVGIFVNHLLGINIALTLIPLLTAIYMNRNGKVVIAGILVVAALDLSLMLNWLSYSSVSIFLLPLLDLLVLPELFAVSLLPPVAVFIDAAIHIMFIVSALTFLFPQDAAARVILHSSSLQDALARPIVIQVSVAVITFLWVTSATQAIARADRATTIAALERAMAEQALQDAEQKRGLEQSVQQIIQTHMKVANGDFSARVPLNKGAVLWEIAGSLNNLLSRMQRWREDSIRLQRFEYALSQYVQAQNHYPQSIIPWKPSGTPVDLLVKQHNAFVQQHSSEKRYL